MKQYHTLTEVESNLLDNYLLNNLEDINKSLNLPASTFTSHHFFIAVDNFFPTWRSEQLANIDDTSYANSDIAYQQYIQRFTNE
jgi:hypothetical protein